MRALDLHGYRIEITGKEDGNARDEKHRVYAKYCSGRQIYGSYIQEIMGDDTGKLDVFCDGLLGTKKESYLGVCTSDCCPIALLGKDFFVVVYGSWKTLYQGILFNALSLLERKKENVVDIQVFFGPSIREKAYEVGREFYTYFPKRFLQKVDGRLTLDLVKFATSQLEFGGVKKGNILIDSYCTQENNDMYYSSRSGESCGNFMGVSRLP